MIFPAAILPDIELHAAPIEPVPGRRRDAETDAVERLVARRFGPKAALVHDAHGAPSIAGRPESISISHGAGWAILAVAPTGVRVGVDIECWRRQLRSVAPRFLTPGERGRITSDAELLQAWTAKEAVFKAAGIAGLTMGGIDTQPGFLTATARSAGFALTFLPFQGALIAIALPGAVRIAPQAIVK